MHNKRGQIADTMTWVVATAVIVVVLTLSVMFSISMSSKKIGVQPRSDILAVKSFTSYLATNNNYQTLTPLDGLKQDSMGKFIFRLFNVLYGQSSPNQKYFEIWIGFGEQQVMNNFICFTTAIAMNDRSSSSSTNCVPRRRASSSTILVNKEIKLENNPNDLFIIMRLKNKP